MDLRENASFVTCVAGGAIQSILHFRATATGCITPFRGDEIALFHSSSPRIDSTEETLRQVAVNLV
jgi:hypothetical protein